MGKIFHLYSMSLKREKKKKKGYEGYNEIIMKILFLIAKTIQKKSTVTIFFSSRGRCITINYSSRLRRRILLNYEVDKCMHFTLD